MLAAFQGMATRADRWCWGSLVVVLTSLIYLSGLQVAPVYVGGDEAHFASHAYSLATTGRDLNGTRLPLFVLITDPLVPNNSSRIWYQPLLFYLLALDFTVLPVAEWSLRLPTVLIGILNVSLVYLIGLRVLARTAYAALAALTLALTPAHFILSRQALDYICPLPFVLGWLWCFIRFKETANARWLLAAGFVLGCGLYSYISSWAIMPFFLAMTMVLLWPSGQTFRAPGFMAVAGFVLPVLLIIPWLWRHPEMLTDTLMRYNLQDGRSLTLWQRVEGAGQFDLAERLKLYWDYFNPSFLLLAGGSNPTMATARVGVFLLPVAVFLVCGVRALWHRWSALTLVLLAGFIAAPGPIAVTMPEAPEYSIARAMLMIPFGVLISAFGAQWLLSSPRRFVRGAAVALLIAMPVQFAMFARDYYTDYQVRSASRFDPVAFRDITATVAALDAVAPAPAVYLSDDMDDKSVRWRFYLLKSGRLDLWQRTQYFEAGRFDSSEAPSGSLLVLYANDAYANELIGSGLVSRVTTVNGVAGDPTAVVLRRH